MDEIRMRALKFHQDNAQENLNICYHQITCLNIELCEYLLHLFPQKSCNQCYVFVVSTLNSEFMIYWVVKN